MFELKKKMSVILFLSMVVLLLSIFASSSFAQVEIVKNGASKGVIVIPANPQWIIQHSAEELAYYFEKISGVKVPVVFDNDTKSQTVGNRILLGSSFTTLPNFDSPVLPYWGDTDGFIIRTVKGNKSNDLVIAGKTLRGTLFATYFLLENYCDIGFFWDGINIPKRDTIEFKAIDIIQKPYFINRVHFQGCAFAYTTDYWSIDDWKRELDWSAWKGINEIMLPDQPSLKEVRDYAKKLGICVMGPDSHTEQLHPHPEMDWGSISPEEMGKSMVREAQTLNKRLETSGDPLMHYEVSNWAFVADPKNWNYENVKAFLTTFPKGKLVIWDLFCDARPTYNIYDYFFGHYWCFGLLHTMGKMNHFHTNIPKLINRVQSVINEPQGKNCIGFTMMPESIHHNILLFELATELAWNPKEVDLDKFLEKFCYLRYGESDVKKMKKSWEYLVNSVYSHDYWITPMYMMGPQIQADIIDGTIFPLLDRFQYIQPCYNALTTALKASEKLGENTLYANDLVDMTRQLIFELFDYHFIQMLSAYVKGDGENFKSYLTACKEILKGLKILLSSDSRYWLQSQIDQLKKVGDPSINKIWAFADQWDKETAEDRKKFEDLHQKRDWETLCRLRWQNYSWADYQRTDMYELFVHSYLPKMELFFEELENHYSVKERYNWSTALDQKYKEISLNWRWQPHPMLPEERYKGSKIKAVKEVLTILKPFMEKPIYPLMGPELSVGSKIGWEEDFSDVSDWIVEGDVILKPKDGTTLAKATSISFSYSVKLNININEYPVLEMRYLPLANNGRFLMVADWVDKKGDAHSNTWLMYDDTGGPQEWTTRKINVQRLFNLIGEPEHMVKITIKFPYGAQEIEWDYLRFSN